MFDSFRSGGNRALFPPAVALSNLLTLQISVALIAALYFAHEVLIPITLAILLSFVLAPLVDFLSTATIGPSGVAPRGGGLCAHPSYRVRRSHWVAGRPACDQDS